MDNREVDAPKLGHIELEDEIAPKALTEMRVRLELPTESDVPVIRMETAKMEVEA